MPRQRTTIDEFDIQGNYGQGFETVTCEATRYLAGLTIQTYRQNEPGVPFKIKKNRVKKSDLDSNQLEAHERAVHESKKLARSRITARYSATA